MNIDDVNRGIVKNKKRKRIGRGIGSGHGKTAGRGHKGAGSRNGTSTRVTFTGGNKAAAEAIGKAIAECAAKAGVTKVRFDRGACKFHGRVAALAEAARAGGLEF